MKTKKILSILLFLILIQFSRVLFKNIIYHFISKTLMADVIVNSIFMLLITGIMIYIVKKKKLQVHIFPEKFDKKYIIITVFLFLFILSTPIITKDYSLYSILFLIYGSIITVVFEEILFRGIVWHEISHISNDIVSYIISTILFGIWHLGYIDTVIWRKSMFSSNTDIANIMLWKVITGFVLGCAFGLCRYKGKNTYLSMFLHSLINTFGS